MYRYSLIRLDQTVDAKQHQQTKLVKPADSALLSVIDLFIVLRIRPFYVDVLILVCGQVQPMSYHVLPPTFVSAYRRRVDHLGTFLRLQVFFLGLFRFVVGEQHRLADIVVAYRHLLLRRLLCQAAVARADPGRCSRSGASGFRGFVSSIGLEISTDLLRTPSPSGWKASARSRLLAIDR